MIDVDLHVKALGARGDGIAEIGRGKVFIPFAVPGDVVRVRLQKSKMGFIAQKFYRFWKQERNE